MLRLIAFQGLHKGLVPLEEDKSPPFLRGSGTGALIFPIMFDVGDLKAPF